MAMDSAGREKGIDRIAVPGGSDFFSEIPLQGDPIAWGAELSVPSNAMVAFFAERRLADLFGPGTYRLFPDRLPLLTTLPNFKVSLETPFFCRLFFCRTRRVSNLRWKSIASLWTDRSAPQSFPFWVQGTFALQIREADLFLGKLFAPQSPLVPGDLSRSIERLLLEGIESAVHRLRIDLTVWAENPEAFNEKILDLVQSPFGRLGVELSELQVEQVLLGKPVMRPVRAEKPRSFQAPKERSPIVERVQESSRAAAQESSEEVLAEELIEPVLALPPILEKVWFAAIEGQPEGPFDFGGLLPLVLAGKITLKTLVWKEGLETWVLAETRPELAALFRSSKI